MSTTLGLDTPLPLSDEGPLDPTDPRTLRPPSWDAYVGQTELVGRLRTKCQAAFNMGQALGHILIAGPMGTGKTTLAHLAAIETGETMAVITRPVTDVGLMEALWELPGYRGILFIDEAHLQPSKTQHALMTLTEDGYVQTRFGTEYFEWVTVVLATTEKREIKLPLQSRLTVFDMAAYSHDDMVAILAGMAERAGVNLNDTLCEGLATATVGVPRMARHLVLGAKELAAVFRPVTLESVLQHAGVCEDGLTMDHLGYLACLKDVGGSGGLEVLSVRLQLHRTQVQRIERLLIDRGYVKYGGGSIGRVLTGAGRARLGAA